MSSKPHRRFNPMKGDWILVSPHRMNRPWAGQLEHPDDDDDGFLKETNPGNSLCPLAKRSNGQTNPDYKSTFVFDNDFPALLDDDEEKDSKSQEGDLFRSEPAGGVCRVMCFHPESTVTFPLMSNEEIAKVIDTWIEQFKELSLKYKWIQIFENKGAAMGCSNPHPHCQIWASDFLPNEAQVKDANFKAYYEKRQRPMLLQYAEDEAVKKERIVCQNSDWIAVVPYWATWPFEVMVMPLKRHIPKMSDVNDEERLTLGSILKEVTTRYDNLFKTNFPYSMGFHGAPTGSGNGSGNEWWQFHALYFPPLLRSATVKKFMVGYEMLANAQRDLTAEQAAKRLRELPEKHFKL